MDVKVLGPLSIEEQGVSIVPSASKPRQVLALLALRADRVVTASTLAEELWGAEAPRSAATTLQTYVLQLRRLIGAAVASDRGRKAKDVLVTRHSGYLLEVQPGRIDAEEFNQLSVAGRQAYESGDDRAASDLLGRGLALWRGPALLDVQAGRVLELDVLGLEEARMGALERRIAADLRLGRHGALIGELRVLVARYPMHENLCMQLMLAFHRSGNSWRALEVFHALRNTLNCELGLEPSARVHRLQQAILRGDPGLDLESSREAFDRNVA